MAGMVKPEIKIHLTVFVTLLILCCPVILPSLAIEEQEERDSDFSDVFADFGTLHTMDKLIYWANKEEEIYQALSDKLGMVNEEIELIEKYITDYDESSGKALEYSKKPLKTPKERGRLIGSSAILAHLMTYRYVTIVNELRTLLQSKQYLEAEDRVNQVLELGKYANSSRQWPNSDDLYVSHVALLHMQDIYFYNPEEFFEGVETPTHVSHFGGHLNALHCTHLGVAALDHEYFYLAVEWLELALQLLEDAEEIDHSISKELVKSLLAVAVKTHNFMASNGPSERSQALFLNTYFKPTYAGESPNDRISGRSYIWATHRGEYGNKSAAELNLLSLCSGFEFQPLEIRSKMKCFYDRDGHPYFILHPLKVEQLSEHPPIFQFYDVLGNSTIEELYKTREEMKMSTVLGNGSERAISVRSSAGGVIDQGVAERVNQKSELISGLLLCNAEGVQHVEYTYGRLYLPHHDSFDGETDPALVEHGDRVATILYYLDVPDEGGLTPFCDVGITARPVRDSAILWFNMFRNGTVRQDVFHAACPVLHGRKTILNQWVRYNTNFQTYRCALNQFE